MAEKRDIFYSFDHGRDHFRASLVRNLDILPSNTPLPGSAWSMIKQRGEHSIKSWIDTQMQFRACVVVLIGKRTSKKKWVNYELGQAWDEGLGVVGLRVHGVKNMLGLTSKKGENPFDLLLEEDSGEKLSKIVKCYDPPAGSRQEICNWIAAHLREVVEEAIQIRQRYPKPPPSHGLISSRSLWRTLQPMSRKNRIEFRRWTRARFNYLSNKLSGSTFSYTGAQYFLEHGDTLLYQDQRERDEMQGHDEALTLVRSLAAQERPVNEKDIKGLNKLCLQEPFEEYVPIPRGERVLKQIIPGEYKTQSNDVLTETGELVRFATPEETPASMEVFVTWFQAWLGKREGARNRALIVFLAELHRRFIGIHPFDDGNGRVVRLLMNYVLIRMDFLPLMLADRDEYFGAIQRANEGDAQPFEKLIADTIEMVYQKVIRIQRPWINLDGEGI